VVVEPAYLPPILPDDVPVGKQFSFNLKRVCQFVAGPVTRYPFQERDIAMTVFYVSSINRLGASVVTRHYLPTAVETEKLRRALDGHTGIAVQEGLFAADPNACTKRAAAAHRPPHDREG